VKKYMLKIIIGLVLLGSTAMATEEWILSQPVQTDTTNYEWVLGTPYIITEAPTGVPVPVFYYHYINHAYILLIPFGIYYLRRRRCAA